MKRILQIVTLAIFTLAFASLAHAQATRTWVSGVGDDANPCSRTAPCKTWAGAISKTATAGEIDALDPGGFGGVTITKAITLDGTGTFASILNAGTQGIIINANLGTVDNVNIRGISINGAATGTNAINLIQADRVNIEDCVIFGSNNGILINESDGVNVNIRNTGVRNNTADGLSVTTTSGVAKVSVQNSSFIGNSFGIHGKGNSRVVVNDSVVSNNGSNGVFAEGISNTAVIDLTNTLIDGNGLNGLQAGGGASTTTSIVRINNCDIFQNTGTGALVSTGEIDTWQNNRIFSNGTDGCSGCIAKGFN